MEDDELNRWNLTASLRQAVPSVTTRGVSKAMHSSCVLCHNPPRQQGHRSRPVAVRSLLTRRVVTGRPCLRCGF
mgnify:CR=1 FL=1